MALYTTDQAPDLTGVCKSNGVPAPCTGATLQLRIKKPSGTVLVKTGTWVDASVGSWSYSWLPNEIDETGTWRVQPRVTYASGKPQTFPEAGWAVSALFA